MKSAGWLTLLLVIGLFLSCSDSLAPPKAASQKILTDEGLEARPKVQAVSKRAPDKFPSLSLDFLFEGPAAAKEEPGTCRNIVTMEDDPVDVAERKKREEEARKQAEEAAKKAAEERKKQAEELTKNPPPPQPPAINFDFLGYMGPPGGRIGVFRIGSGETNLVLKKKGEKIGDDYIIVDIGYESAEIGFEGFKETKTIPLTIGGK